MTQPFASLPIGSQFRFAGSPATYRKASEFHGLLVQGNGDHRAASRSGVDANHPVIVEG